MDPVTLARFSHVTPNGQIITMMYIGARVRLLIDVTVHHNDSTSLRYPRCPSSVDQPTTLRRAQSPPGASRPPWWIIFRQYPPKIEGLSSCEPHKERIYGCLTADKQNPLEGFQTILSNIFDFLSNMSTYDIPEASNYSLRDLYILIDQHIAIG